MSNIPISVCGTVATVPSTRTLSTGRACASFRLAVNHWRIDKSTGEFVSDTTSWFGVDCYGSLATNVAPSLFQGMSVVVQGHLRIREWATEERSGVAPTIIADHLGPDLRFGTAHYQKSAGSYSAKTQASAPAQESDSPSSSWGLPDAPAENTAAVLSEFGRPPESDAAAGSAGSSDRKDDADWESSHSPGAEVGDASAGESAPTDGDATEAGAGDGAEGSAEVSAEDRDIASATAEAVVPF